MTEVSPLGAVARPPADATPEEAVAYQQTQGRFLFGVEARIADDDGVVLPSDGTGQGELQVRGPWVTGSYYRGTGSATFTDDGWMRTGDVGTLDDGGYLRITDRAKDVIKSGGEWLSSVLLEIRISEHPDVAEVAVIGVPDPRWQERPLAIVASKSGEPLDPAPLRAWLGEQVARWWVPERWAFVAEVPHTSTGKIDKKLLREQYAADLLTVIYLDRT
jgi:fatty-acyl-CoA synthase